MGVKLVRLGWRTGEGFLKSKYKFALDFEERLARARLPALLMVLLGLLVLEPTREHLPIAALAVFYLLLSVKQGITPWPLPEWFFPATDVIVLFLLVVAPHALLAFWFYFLYVLFGAGVRRGLSGAWGLAALWGFFMGFWQVAVGRHDKAGIVHAAALAAATATGGVLLAWMGEMEHRAAEREGFLEETVRLLRYELGLRESLRRLLTAVAREFESESTCIVIRDEKLERLFYWKIETSGSGELLVDSATLDMANQFLMDDMAGSLCWNALDGEARGFGWKENKREQAGRLPPQPLAEELHARSLMTVPMESSAASSEESTERSFGRMFVLNGRRRYSASDLRWFERAVTCLALPIENLFLLRHLRAQAVEAERRRLAGDLHDGLLQSLLSLNIQLDVLRHRVEETDKALEMELAGLQRVVQHEESELRRMVTDLRPLRIESADLPDMMLGLAQRFRQETGIALDVFIEDQDLRIPTRVCREIFQIYKESLQNIKKHAKAGHVVVKLDHDETRALLVIDDNGEGFDFSGKYTGDELDNLRLGPISIKERARHVGGNLTLESNPGRGARLTIEIPLS